MHYDASASGASLVETSRAEHAPTETEAEFLHRQAAEARAAMGAALGDAGQSLDQACRQATDLRGWIEGHPWLALGAAVGAGFAGGMAFTPASHNGAAAARSDRPAAFDDDGEERVDRVRPSRLSSIIPWEMLIAPITELARTLVENLFAAYVASRAASQAAAASAEAGAHPAAAPCASASPLEHPVVEQAMEA